MPVEFGVFPVNRSHRDRIPRPGSVALLDFGQGVGENVLDSREKQDTVSSNGDTPMTGVQGIMLIFLALRLQRPREIRERKGRR